MNDHILQILEAIGYEDDKDTFVQRFTGIVQINVITHYLASLPQDQQDKIENDFSENPDPEKFLAFFTSLFPEDEVKKTYTDEMDKAIKNWLETINSTLSEEQKEKVKALTPTV